MLDRAREAADAGDHRWLPELLAPAADPGIGPPASCRPIVFEQLGYQAESGPVAQSLPARRRGTAQRHPPSPVDRGRELGRRLRHEQRAAARLPHPAQRARGRPRAPPDRAAL
ncbi:hypothetical protein HBB16_04745 [Pseudonocardia sp. MCCB 268]|nr:hypothetical protein [Pseudonocardia cytotoxica]